MADGIVTVLISKVLDSYPVALLIAGAIFLGLGITGGIAYNNLLPIPDDFGRITAIIVGVAFVVLSGLRARPRSSGG